MTEIWLTRGLPASGKSTWAKRMVGHWKDGDQQVIDPSTNFVRVNMDDIRDMLGFGPGSGTGLSWSKEMETTALEVQDKAILSAVKMGHDVIVDNTHIEQKMPKRIKRLFDGEVTFRVKDFSHISSHDCILRDNIRMQRGQRSVGAEVIQKMANRMKNAKWMLTEEWMNDIVLSPPYEKVPYNIKAIVVDIDGTLAKHVSRSPYDYTRVRTDAVHQHVADLVHMYDKEGYAIILLSGRPDIDNVRADTERWLRDHSIVFDELYMRPADRLQDNDADIKQDLFDEHIRYNYNVAFMLDDRNRVTRRIRKLNVPVLQVADGDF